MKVAMSLCLCFDFQSLKAPYWVYLVSSCLGFTTDILVNMGFDAMAGSAVQMVRGGKVVITMILSACCLGRRQFKYQLLGSALVCIGITFVGTSAFLDPAQREEKAPSNSRIMRSLGFTLAGELCQATLWVFQEMVVKKYSIPPLQLVGLEGIIGVFVGSAFVASLNVLGLEDTLTAFHQISHSVALATACASFLVSVALFNYSGLNVTKQGSAVARSVIDVSRGGVIWLVEIAIGWHLFSFMQAIGFAILAVGAFMYNHIVIVPVLEPDDEQLPVAVK